MKTSTYAKVMFLLGLGGLLFSGYLSAVKFFTSTCAFSEPCPYFLGYPACWYGFTMFLIIFISSAYTLFKNTSEETLRKILLVVSGIGIIFAGSFTIPEIGKLISGAKTGYSLGLPTCAYGLIFYLIIFIYSAWTRNKN